MNISRFAIAKPVTTAMLYIAVAFLGIVSFARLPVDLLPDISYPTLTITTNYTGAGPQEVEREITTLLENTFSTVPGVTEITSNSIEGRSTISLRFAWGTDLSAAANDVRPTIDRVRSRLPSGADSPRVSKFDPNIFPIVTLGIEGRGDLSIQRDIAENELKPRLEQIEGVANVDVRGTRDRQIQVRLDARRLAAFGLSEREINAALRSESVIDPGGDVRVGAQRRVVRTTGQFSTVGEVAQTVVAVRGGVPLRVSDVARVQEGLADATSLVRIGGQPSIMIAVSKQSGTNTVAVANRVFRVVRQLNEQFPQTQLTVVTDGSRYIRRSIANVQQAAMMGAALTVIVLLAFLRNMSSTLIISTAIPISVMATFLLMFSGGLTLNLITFGGLALAIGMLVDNAIVVLENIFRHREEGRPPKIAADEATAEVGTALVASTLTTIVVFLPMFFTTGISSVMFRPLAYVVTFSLVCSLAVAVTLIPSLGARALVIGHGKGAAGRLATLAERAFASVENGFRRLLMAVMRRPALVVVPAVAVMILTWAALPRIGRETFPQADEREFILMINQPRGTSLEASDRAARRVEQMLVEEVPGVAAVLTTVGGGGFGGGGTHSTSFRVRLENGAGATRDVIADLRRRVNVPGANLIFRPISSLFFFRSPDPISIDLRGFDLEAGNSTARRLRGVLEAIPGVTDLQVSREESAEEFTVRVDPTRASSFGVSAAQVASSVRTYVGGTTAALYRAGGEDVDVIVRLQESDRTTPDQIGDLPISTPRGIVPLRQLAKIVGTPGPTQIQRRNRERIITLTGNVTGRDLGETLADVRSAMLKERLPAGFSFAFGGEYQEQRESFGQLTTGFLMSLVLVYMVMASQFERLLEPFLIMATVPFALVGVALSLLITGTTLNVQSGLGAIVLVGLSVNSAIVLMTYALQLRNEGVPLREALARAGQRRLRPILMTTFTTSFGLLPLAIGFGAGSELQAPLARAIVGGIVTAMIGSLLLIPALYVWLDGAIAWAAGRRRREMPSGALEPGDGE